MKVPTCIPQAAQACRRLALTAGVAMASGAIANGAQAFAAEDIRDIRGPKAVPGSWIVPAIVVAALLVTIALATGIWWRRHRGARRRNLTLSELTLERLEATKPLMQPATAREFGIAASEVIRNYIEKRFEVVATQRTTEEFLQTLLQGSNVALARHRSLLAQFLH